MQLETLNGLRGVAAVAVVLFHCSSAVGLAIAPSGYLAVDFFFVLSGFVIARIYESRLRAGMSAKVFVWKRAVRFYPLYLLGTVLGLAVVCADFVLSPPANLAAWQLAPVITSAVLYLPSPVTEGLFPLNVPAWSLFFELAVNALFALIIWRMASRYIAAVAAAMLAILIVLVVDFGSAAGGDTWSTFTMGAVRTVFAFSIGNLIARMDHPRCYGARVSAVLCAVLAILLIVPVSSDMRPLYDLAVIVVASPAIVFIGARVKPTGLDPALRWLGLISFPIYAIHYPFADALRTISRHVEPSIAVTLLLVLLLVASTVIGRLEMSFQQRIGIGLPRSTGSSQ